MNEDRHAGIVIQGLSVSYADGVRALSDVNLSVPAGSVAALVGVNGAGKSTLFKAIMGFLPARSGAISLLGLPVKQALARNLVAYVPQSEEVDWSFPVLVEDVVMMGRFGAMNFLRLPKRRDHALVSEALERVGMAELRKRQIGELSGGQKKRVFLARALAQQASVILLDEPFTGVDVQTEDALIALMLELRDQGCVMLVSTHNLGSVPEYCDRTILLRGTVLAEGETRDVFTQDNLQKTFGGVLRHFVLAGETLHNDDDQRQVTVISDDERPYVVYGEKGEASPRKPS